ncbi:uncharacterized protein METZ01_LOCUS363955, partial [marine metagenome]
LDLVAEVPSRAQRPAHGPAARATARPVRPRPGGHTM